jgi:hypothetical protein
MIGIKKYRQNLTVVVTGKSRVGKTTMCLRFCKK